MPASHNIIWLQMGLPPKPWNTFCGIWLLACDLSCPRCYQCTVILIDSDGFLVETRDASGLGIGHWRDSSGCKQQDCMQKKLEVHFISLKIGFRLQACVFWIIKKKFPAQFNSCKTYCLLLIFKVVNSLEMYCWQQCPILAVPAVSVEWV